MKANAREISTLSHIQFKATPSPPRASDASLIKGIEVPAYGSWLRHHVIDISTRHAYACRLYSQHCYIQSYAHTHTRARAAITVKSAHPHLPIPNFHVTAHSTGRCFITDDTQICTNLCGYHNMQRTSSNSFDNLTHVTCMFQLFCDIFAWRDVHMIW
jgi:hypothetical protein